MAELLGGARRAAAPAAHARRAQGRLRPLPRGHRRRAGDLGHGGQGPPAPGPKEDAGPAVRGGRDGMPTQCDEIAVLLPDAVDSAEPVALPVRRHIESCLRCQAELARYRRMLRGAPAPADAVLRADARDCSRRPWPASPRRASGARSPRRSPSAGRRTPARSRARSPRPAPPPRRAPGPGEAPHRPGLTRPARPRAEPPLCRRPRCYPLSALRTPAQRAVAQLVELRSPKPAVGGSSPSCPALPGSRPSACRSPRRGKQRGEPTDQTSHGEAGRRQAARARTQGRSPSSSPPRRRAALASTSPRCGAS